MDTRVCAVSVLHVASAWEKFELLERLLSTAQWTTIFQRSRFSLFVAYLFQHVKYRKWSLHSYFSCQQINFFFSPNWSPISFMAQSQITVWVPLLWRMKPVNRYFGKLKNLPLLHAEVHHAFTSLFSTSKYLLTLAVFHACTKRCWNKREKNIFFFSTIFWVSMAESDEYALYWECFRSHFIVFKSLI